MIITICYKTGDNIKIMVGILMYNFNHIAIYIIIESANEMYLYRSNIIYVQEGVADKFVESLKPMLIPMCCVIYVKTTLTPIQKFKILKDVDVNND